MAKKKYIILVGRSDCYVVDHPAPLILFLPFQAACKNSDFFPKI